MDETELLAMHLQELRRGTVVLAFQQLVDQGFLIARERRGHFVNPEVLATPAKPLQKGNEVPAGQVDWKARRRIAASEMPRPAKHENWIKYSYPFVYGQFDPALFPTAEWRECNRMALAVLEIRNWAADMVDRDDPLLIEQIQARLLPRRGVVAGHRAAEDVVVEVDRELAARQEHEPDLPADREPRRLPDDLIAREVLAEAAEHREAERDHDQHQDHDGDRVEDDPARIEPPAAECRGRSEGGHQAVSAPSRSRRRTKR